MESRTLIKIGISSDPYKRVERLNETLVKEDKFKVIHSVNCVDNKEAYATEQTLHREFKQFNIKTDILGAKTECFSKDCLPIVYEYLKNNKVSLHYYDPFIYLDSKDVCKVLGSSIPELAKLHKISKAFMKKFSQVIRNLAANVVIADGRKIFYTGNQMNSFSVATTYTTKIFNLLYPAFSAILPLSSEVEVKLIKLNHWCKWFHKFEIATKTHIANLYSITLYKYGDGERSDRYLRKIIAYHQVMGNNDNCIVEVK